LNELALFAGAGGGILGGTLLGWRTVCAVEINAFCARRLMQRQNEGHLAPFPIWDDVCSFDGHPWRGLVDVVSGGFPCQDISSANPNAEGIDGERSGLWSHMFRIGCQIRPRYWLLENSPMLVGRGLARILGNFASVGYHARWGCFYAADVGAPHPRERIFLVASDANRNGEPTLSVHDEVAKLRKVDAISISSDAGKAFSDPNVFGCEGSISETVLPEPRIQGQSPRVLEGWNLGWPISESCVVRVDDGVAQRVDRTRAVGNGQVPDVVRFAWRTLNP